MTKLILTDIDEVVLRFHEAVENWIRNNPYVLDGLGISTPNINNHLDLKQDMGAWLNTDEDKIIVLIELFSRTQEFGDIKPGWESDHYIPKLYNEGYKFIGITACGNNPVTKSLRIQNLERYFPKMFSAVHTVDFIESKKGYLSFYKPSYWVEDKKGNAMIGRDCGHKSWLMANVHNGGPLPCGMKRATSWKTIYECVSDADCQLQGWMC